MAMIGRTRPAGGGPCRGTGRGDAGSRTGVPGRDVAHDAGGDDDRAGERRTVAALAARAQGGDRAAFDALVQRFRAPIAAYCHALLRDPGLAEDAAQEAFLAAWERLPRLRDAGAFRAWLYRIAEHAAISGRRRRRRFAGMTLLDADVPERAATVAPPASGPILAVREAMASLPEAYAGVLSMHYVQSLSCREIARLLGITQNNARQRLYRARRALRRDAAKRGFAPAGPGGGRDGEASAAVSA